MSSESSRARQPLYTQIDVSTNAYPPVPHAGRGELSENTLILREILAAQDRQNELLEEMVSQMSLQGKQRANELGQWKQANPRLARNCRKAAESLGKIQTEFLDSLTQEINTNFETLVDGEFMLNEFIDRFGPRMAHLNGMLQVLAMLSATPNPTNTPNTP
jgi:DNA anti-recombination protein RmuC